MELKRGAAESCLFSGSYSFIWGILGLNFICNNTYRTDISIHFFATGQPFLPPPPLQTAQLLEFKHLSHIPLEQVISRPTCKYLHHVLPFQLRAGWRSEHKLRLLQHILMGSINTRDQAHSASSQQGQTSTPVKNSFHFLNHSYLHYSAVKITLFSDKTAKQSARDDIPLQTQSNKLPLDFSAQVTANKRIEIYRKDIKFK